MSARTPAQAELDDDGSAPWSDGRSGCAAEGDRVAGDSSGARRPLPQLDREHRRRLDALGAQQVRLPAHDGHAANTDIQTGHLADCFDVVVLPSQSPRGILDGHRPDDTRPRAGPWNPVPAEYQGGIGDPGLEVLKAFVNAGGTPVAFDQASDSATDRFGGVFTHVHDVVQGLDQKTFYCPGSVLKIGVYSNAPWLRHGARGRGILRGFTCVRNRRSVVVSVARTRRRESC